MSPEQFWALSYREFANILIYTNPALNSSTVEFFDEEELALLEQMRKW